MSVCEHETFRATVGDDDSHAIIGSVCLDCGEVLGTGVLEWTRCVCCCRGISECMKAPCDGRDPVKPWRLMVEQR